MLPARLTRRAPRRSTPPASRRAVAELAATIVLFGSSFPAYKLATDGVAVGTVAAARFALASLVLVATLGIPALDRRTWTRVLAVGAVGLGGQALAMTAGIDAGTSTLGALILGLEPIGIAIVAVLAAGERPPRATLLGLALGIAGVAVVSGLVTSRTTGLPAAAVAYLLVTVVLFGLYTVAVRRMSARVAPTAIAVVTSLGGMALTLPLAAVDAARGEVVHRGAGWSAAAAVAYLGVGTAVAYLLFARVLARIDASRFAVVLYAVPTLGVVASWAVLGERPLGRDVAGGGIILLAVWISERARARAGGSIGLDHPP